MAGHPHGDCGKTRGDNVRDLISFGKDDGQGARPEPVDQLLRRAGDIRDQPSQVIRAGDMNDQRIKMRSLLDFEDPGDGKRSKGVRSQAIHGLRGKGNDPSPLDDLCGVVNSPGLIHPWWLCFKVFDFFSSDFLVWALKASSFLCDIGILDGEDFAGQVGGILCSVNPDGGHRNARRHLDRGVERIHAVEGP